MAREGKKGNWVLELLVAVMVVGCLLGIGYLVWRGVFGPRSAAVPAPPAATRAVVELWDAYERARAAAQSQALDAQLVSASAQWQTADERALLAGASEWSFVFHSPGSGNALDVGVSAGAAQLVKETRVRVAPTALAGDAWGAGPKDALLAFLAYEGRVFLEGHPEAIVDLHLSENDEGRPVWTIVALDVSDRSLLSVVIDAETGEVLSYAS